MGCSLFISQKDNVTNTIFMHSDSWGQYGPETDDSTLLNKFIEGLDCYTQDWFEFINIFLKQVNKTHRRALELVEINFIEKEHLSIFGCIEYFNLIQKDLD